MPATETAMFSVKLSVISNNKMHLVLLMIQAQLTASGAETSLLQGLLQPSEISEK